MTERVTTLLWLKIKKDLDQEMLLQSVLAYSKKPILCVETII